MSKQNMRLTEKEVEMINKIRQAEEDKQQEQQYIEPIYQQQQYVAPIPPRPAPQPQKPLLYNPFPPKQPEQIQVPMPPTNIAPKISFKDLSFGVKSAIYLSLILSSSLFFLIVAISLVSKPA